MRIPHTSFWTVSVILGVLVCPSDAHNGGIAIAVPVEGIVVNGDLSDWPEDTHFYRIRQNTDAYGETDLSGTDLDTSADLSPEFAVGYSLAQQLIYVGVRIRDDAVQTGTGSLVTDACEVYLGAGHGADRPYQYVMSPEGGSYPPSGANPSLNGRSFDEMGATRSQGRVSRAGDVTVYEWGLQLLGSSRQDSLKLMSGMTLSFDVVAVDKDSDSDTPAWVAWTPEGRKTGNPELLGDLILVEREVAAQRVLSMIEDDLADMGVALRDSERAVSKGYQRFFTAIPLTVTLLLLPK